MGRIFQENINDSLGIQICEYQAGNLENSDDKGSLGHRAQMILDQFANGVNRGCCRGLFKVPEGHSCGQCKLLAGENKLNRPN